MEKGRFLNGGFHHTGEGNVSRFELTVLKAVTNSETSVDGVATRFPAGLL